MKYLVGFLVILLAYGCTSQDRKTEDIPSSDSENMLELSDQQLQSFLLSKTSITERFITQTLKLNGKIEVPPQSLISISSALGGYLKSTKLLPGMAFRKGDVLAELEDSQFIQLQQDYLVTKAQLQNAEAEYLRQQDLNQSKASSDKVYFQARADYQTLLVNLRSLAQKLKLIHIDATQLTVNNIRQTVQIYAPFDGFTSQVFLNVGRYISSSDVLFELVNPKELHLNLKVFEKDWENIRIGQKVTTYSNTNTSKTYSGEVMLIGKNISSDRAVDVRVRLHDGSALLIPGRYMNAEIIIPEHKALALPEESVVDFEGERYVFEALPANKFKMIAVTCGESGDGWIAIENSSKLLNRQIVQQGAYTLLMALKNKGEE